MWVINGDGDMVTHDRTSVETLIDVEHAMPDTRLKILADKGVGKGFAKDLTEIIKKIEYK